MRFNEKGLGWKSRTGKTVAITAPDLVKAEWIPLMGKLFQLKITAKGGSTFRFNGFPASNHNELKGFFDANYRLELRRLEYNTTGRNWGQVAVRGIAHLTRLRDDTE